MLKWFGFKKKNQSLKDLLFKKNRDSGLYVEKIQDVGLLRKSSLFFKHTLLDAFKSSKNQDLQQKISDAFVRLDFGAFLSEKLSQQVFSKINSHDFKFEVKQLLKECYGSDSSDLNVDSAKTNFFLVVGSNGTGKTTSIAKLAHRYKEGGYRILIVAADTFRAGAVEQLRKWANELEVDIVLPSKPKEDPGALVYRALEKNKDSKYDLIICDTSGRQHTDQNLLREIGKIYKNIKKFDPNCPVETLLTIDSSLGQSSFLQVKNFLEHVDITGIILTKMDSMTRGGVIFAIKNQFKIPVKLVGVGEAKEDLIDFNLDEILDSWLKGFPDSFQK